MKTREVCHFHPGDIRGGIFADSMGLGKSLSMISLIATDRCTSTQTPSQPRKTLLIVPSSLLQTWEAELIRHLHPGALRYLKYHGTNRTAAIEVMLSHDIILTSYDIVASEWRQIDQAKRPLYRHDWNRIVLDEGIYNIMS